MLICQFYRPEAIKSLRPRRLFLIILSLFSIFSTTTHEKPISSFLKGVKWFLHCVAKVCCQPDCCEAGLQRPALSCGNDLVGPDLLGPSSFPECSIPSAGHAGHCGFQGGLTALRGVAVHAISQDSAQGTSAQHTLRRDVNRKPLFPAGGRPGTDGVTQCPAPLTATEPRRGKGAASEAAPAKHGARQVQGV